MINKLPGAIAIAMMLGTPAIAETTPPGETAFIAAIKNAYQSYNAAENDMAKGAARPARKKAICRLLPNMQAIDWVGKISKLTTNGDGKGVLVINIDDDVSVKTWNNSLSDISDHTLIDPESNLYRQAVRLRVGQIVRFSGQFIKNDTDCIREASLTMNGSMRAPEFILQFSDITSELSPERADVTPTPPPAATHFMEHRDCWTCDQPNTAIDPCDGDTSPMFCKGKEPSRRTAEAVRTALAQIPPAVPATTLSPMFQKGLADRTAWETWILSLSSDYRTGAEYWAGQRSLARPGPCYGPPAFTAGCEAAKARLTPADVLRKSDADYKAGWNAYGH